MKLSRKDTTIVIHDVILEDVQDAYGHYTIPDEVTVIGSHAFMFSPVSKVTFNKNLRKIGYCAFSNCKNMIELILPEGLVEIEYGAFSECRGLEIIDFPFSLHSLKGDLFSNCPNVKRVLVPDHLLFEARREFGPDVTIIIKPSMR